MSPFKLAIAVLFTLCITVGFKGYMLYQAVSPNPIIFWQASSAVNKQVIDHQLWRDLLKTYVLEDTGQGSRTFNYSMVTPQDKAKLHEYLSKQQQIDPRDYQKNEQLAYWINLYNALTIDLVLKNYPIESIKDIGDGITGPWNIELAIVAGQPMTLNQIEHGILRGLWKDNRVHYVINCASIGCPDLSMQPITGSTIEQQLNEAAVRFINQPKGVQLNGNTLVLSSIYNWFMVDFGESEEQLLRHLTQYAKPPLNKKIANFKGAIEYDYNWKLSAP